MKEQDADEYFRERKSELLHRRRRRKAILLVIAGLCLSFALSGGAGSYYFGIFRMPSDLMLLIAFVLLVLFFGLVTYFYLQGGIFLAEQFESFEEEEARVYRGIWNKEDSQSGRAELEESFSKLEKTVAEAMSGDQKEIVEVVKEAVISKASEEFWADLSAAKSKLDHLESAQERLDGIFYDSKNRLLSEIQSLSKRGNVNLALGVATTLAAIVLLGTFAFDVTHLSLQAGVVMQDGTVIRNGESKILQLALMFLPKMSLAIFMQVFAFFFLRLYKSSLSDIKYFQNELTNSESKYLGIQVSLIDGLAPALEVVVRDLMGTERNHVLAQGQTTIELEKHKMEHASSTEVMKLIPKLFGRKSP